MSDARDTSALFGMRGRLDAVERDVASLSKGGGSGTTGGVSDDWKASVDSQLRQLHEDFRRLVGWLIAAVAAPLLAIFGLYVFTGQKTDALAARLSDLESKRLTSIEVEQAKQGAKLDLLLERTRPKPRGQ